MELNPEAKITDVTYYDKALKQGQHAGLFEKGFRVGKYDIHSVPLFLGSIMRLARACRFPLPGPQVLGFCESRRREGHDPCTTRLFIRGYSSSGYLETIAGGAGVDPCEEPLL